MENKKSECRRNELRGLMVEIFSTLTYCGLIFALVFLLTR